MRWIGFKPGLDNPAKLEIRRYVIVTITTTPKKLDLIDICQDFQVFF